MITIVGAGVHGLSLAYHLIRKGINDITIVEAVRVGYGSSGRNLARFRLNFNDENNVKFAREAIQYMWKARKKLNLNPMIYKAGYLWLLKKEKDISNFRRLDVMWKTYEVKGGFIECKDFRYINFEGECYFSPESGAFHHDYLTYGIYDKIKDVAKFVYGNVTGINVRSGKVASIRVNSTDLETEKLIVTAGAWTPRLLSPIGVNLPITPVRKEAYITEDIEFRIKPLIIDAESGVSFSQTLKGEIIGGGPEEKEGYVEFSTSFFHMLNFLRTVKKIVNGLHNIGVLRSWSGYYEMTPDRSHIMGYDSSWPENLFVDAGYSGHGMMFGLYSGKLMSDLVADNTASEFIRIFGPSRFNEGRLLAESMVI
ncbi:FAD-dependent oxidoreductase [Sulfolobales archaeon HS-7]|nr:FAD-dependent oxidoreductase [Sulfolobales archaeon HS-7]